MAPATSLRLQTDGWGRVSLDGQSDSGLNNVTLSLNQTLPRDERQRLCAALGITLPAQFK